MVITSLPREWNEKGVSKLEAIQKSLLNQKDVVNASISYEVPDGNAGNRYNFRSGQVHVDMPLLNVDENFGSTYGLKILAGNFFHAGNGDYQKDRVVLSERAANDFGWTPEEALGNLIISEEHGIPLTVVGVVKDFHFYSLFRSVEPISMVHLRDNFSYRYLSLRLKSEYPAGTVERLQAIWIDVFPEAPFDYVFMDDKVSSFMQLKIGCTNLPKSHHSNISLWFAASSLYVSQSGEAVRRLVSRRVHGATSFGHHRSFSSGNSFGTIF